MASSGLSCYDEVDFLASFFQLDDRLFKRYAIKFREW